MRDNLYDILTDRGFIAQSTDADIAKRFETPQTIYAGFDPTADSLHLGHLVPIMGLAHAQRCGHRPLAVVGGATALVGDPSGKTESRRMLTREDVAANARALGAQIGRFVRFGDGPTDARLLDNADWLADLNWIAMLREVGPCISVNRMLTMDSVKGRLESGGITFLEFNYMIMQAYDFLHLNRTHGCTVQVGGQDQWGNIVMGIELGRRLADAELAGLTFPLVTKADGSKFGKTEKGAVWLSAERTPIYDFYQFWRNTADADVGKFLGFFTFLPMTEVRRMTAEGGEALNYAKDVLAFEATALVHGAGAAEQAQDSARKAFGVHKDVSGDSIPHAALTAAEVEAGVPVVALLVRAGLAKSNGEARRLVEGGGVSLHDQRVDDANLKAGADAVKDGYILLRAGKKRMFRFDVA
ncbi:MAG: tyrosine--tRNA ligase [Planctomycetes bacterium]|nr:tyrosine--tRNA ligase [Planctomycetota bacterium]